jgi:hypothetical protein
MKLKKDDQDQQNDLPVVEISGVDDSRRKFNKAGVIAPVLLTLSSKPVWAFECGVSGTMSGNISAQCTLPPNGFTIDQWKNAATWPTGLNKDDKFDVVFGVSNSQSLFGVNATLLQVLSGQALNSSANVSLAFGSCTGIVTNLKNALPLYAQQNIASALNALVFKNYKYPGKSVFYSAVTGGACNQKATKMGDLTTSLKNLTT